MISGSIDVIPLDPKEYFEGGQIIGLRLLRQTDNLKMPTTDQYGNHWSILQDVTPATAQIERNLRPEDRRRPFLGNAKNIRAAHDHPWITLRLLSAKIEKAWLEPITSKKDQRKMQMLRFAVVPCSEKEKEADPLTDYKVMQDPGQFRRLNGEKPRLIGMGNKHERTQPKAAAPPPDVRDEHDPNYDEVPPHGVVAEDDIPF